MSNDDRTARSGKATFASLVDIRLSRRDALKVLGASATMAAFGGKPMPNAAQAASGVGGLAFKELAKTNDTTHHVAEGYEARVLIRWGDPVLPGAPTFDPANLAASAQEKQFGYNCDFIAYLPLPASDAAAPSGLLCVNHEYTIPELMFPGYEAGEVTKEQVEIEMAAHGHSVVEIGEADGEWHLVADSLSNRRLSALSTEIVLSGPAAGHDRLKTSADPTGTRVIGTLSNCAGGTTPWGTVLIAEENFHLYFAGEPPKGAEAANFARIGIEGRPKYRWHQFFERFDVVKEPNEPNRFGWVVELDPYEPASIPAKRTALGRFRHEAATCVVNKDGRIVVYLGDDARFEYIYRFVSAGAFDATDRSANMGLLDSGTLSVAKFKEDGSVAWLPLIHGQGPLSAENGFGGQADVLIETRRAADLLGATKMDRPEDIETNPINGRVYVILTNNPKREVTMTDAANPRAPNIYGHIIELIPPGGDGPEADHAADRFTWEIFLMGGNPRNPEHRASYHPDVSMDGWLTTPDNCTFDQAGNLWIATNGAPKVAGFADGLWATPVAGPSRALTKLFFTTPIGAEPCGPCFTPDNQSLFLAIQHPADVEGGANYEKPLTRWPDFEGGMPPRPSVVVIRKKGGGVIGS